MLTNYEINALNLSPTKKDFVQIWNELLDVAGKLSERWDPTSTNESDPGIVLLKALTGIADKLNYNIDKNILEAFMPTAAQEDSMRKLCEMLGYNVKYYRSAETEATIKYYNTDPSEEEVTAINSGLYIPKFTVLTNGDKDINYFTTNQTPIYIAADSPTQTIKCMEGQIVKCDGNNENQIITVNQIDENNRFYLPETQVAENGIFIYNVFYNSEEALGSIGLEDGTLWTKVDNLNIYSRGTKVFKFGYDSYASRPYIEFPDDYSELFENGLFIYYTRTSGIQGNISSHTLTQLEPPNLPGWANVPADSFSVDNIFAATSGANIETIKQAYNNFKKTIGTFETLVTCRDYMNKVYSMINSVGKPYVSNILVTDMRNDINRAVTICSCDDAGIYYKERSIVETKETERTVTEDVVLTNLITKPVWGSSDTVWRDSSWHLGSVNGPILLDNTWVVGPVNPDDSGFTFDYGSDAAKYSVVYNDENLGFWVVDQVVNRNTPGQERVVKFKTNLSSLVIEKDHATRIEREWTTEPLINHFDLIFYPFKSYSQIKSELKNVRSVYDSSFEYTNIGFNDIKARLEADDLKTISHNILTPRPGNDDFIGDIVSINNYLRLNATIATNTKITIEEGELLKQQIKTALANAFNMRELDFGEEIPLESIIKVIENADARIKVVSLNEPALYTTYSVLDHMDASGQPVTVEYAVASDYLSLEDAEKFERFTYTDSKGYLRNSFDTPEARQIYNKLVLRNILAGRVALFNYNKTFTVGLDEAPYQQNILYSEGTSIDARPSSKDFPKTDVLEDPTEESPYNIWVENGTTYTARLLKNGTYIYNKIKEPSIFNNGVITEDDKNNKITKFTPFCKVAVHDAKIPGNSNVSDNSSYYPAYDDVQTNTEGSDTTTTPSIPNSSNSSRTNDNGLELVNGETIKFRAPNFTTIKTYPAYVNYRLDLDNVTDNNGEAQAAEADSLFNILDSDRSDWKNTDTGKKIKWQKVLDYFSGVDLNNSQINASTDYVQKFTLKQDISKFTYAVSSGEDLCPVNGTGQHEIDPTQNVCRHCGAKMFSSVQKGAIIVDIKNNSSNEKDVESLFAKSGCVKLTNSCTGYDADTQKYLFRAKLLWNPANGETAPPGDGPNLDIDIGLPSPFITDIGVLANIKELVTTGIEERRNMVKEDHVTPVLPSECSWTVSFDFECVPFEPASLNEWTKFIKTCIQSGTNYSTVLPFTPVEELGTVFWRTFGEGYQVGKYVLNSTQKLLKFDKNYFGLLPQNSYLSGIYLTKYLGKNLEPHIIHNSDEYQLQNGEYLYIEYTPSSTTEEGTSQDLPPITEIHGPGTIIHPSGFEAGLIDSDVYESQGNSPVKVVTFTMPDGSIKDIKMYRFGANEQVEIRDYSRVELSWEAFESTQCSFYIYKNFNDCPELETLPNSLGETRSYTLKDGEFIFYTDQNKSEIAYFASGTEIQLYGEVVLPKCEIIDLADIFDSSIEEIPWKYMSFDESNKKIVFQEFQYITLSQKDTIKNISLANPIKEDGEGNYYLDSNWTFCYNVQYSLAGDDSIKTLPSISVPSRAGDGWEVCSLLDVSVSPSEAQCLSYIPNTLETGIILEGVAAGGENGIKVISPKNAEDTAQTMWFKTNLACQAQSDSSVYLKEIYNKDKVDGFQFKFFVKSPISIMKTLPGRVVPESLEALDTWKGEPIRIKDYSDIWNQVSLDRIRVNENEGAYDNALSLSVSPIPNTHGVLCIYVTYTSTDAINNARTWIEVAQGTDHDDIQIFNNRDNNIWETEKGKADKLILFPGVNCIRVKNTCKLYIKASENAQGTLLFDDLKLIACDSITYELPYNENAKNELKDTATTTEDDTKAAEIKYHTIPTYGFNLKQLKYLPVNVENNKLDNNVRAKMEKALCDKLFEDIDNNIALKAEEDFAEGYTYFTNDYEELLGVINDLTVLHNLYSDGDYDILKEQHVNLSKSIADKKDLLEQLSTKAIEEDLLKLISLYAPSETAKASLLDELSMLKAQLTALIQHRTTEELLTSFGENFANKDTALTADVLTESVDFTVQKLESNMLTQLTNLVNDLERIAAGEEKARIIEVLNKLQAATKASHIIDAQLILNKIYNNAEIGDITSLVNNMTALYTTSEFAALATQATALRNIVASRNILFYIEAINAAIADGNEQAKELAAELKNIANQETKLIAELDKLIQECVKATPNTSIIDSSFNNIIYSNEYGINTLYKKTITDLITTSKSTDKSLLEQAIAEIFGNNLDVDIDGDGTIDTNVMGSFRTLIARLELEAKEEANNIIVKICELLDEHEESIREIKKFSDSTTVWAEIRSNKNFDIFGTIVSNLWLQAFQRFWSFVFADIETAIIALINVTDDATNDNPLPKLLNERLEGVQTSFVNYQSIFDIYDNTVLGIDTLNTIIDAAVNKAQAAIRNQATAGIIDIVRKTIGASDIISTAASKFDVQEDLSIYDYRNTILAKLLKDFSSLEVTLDNKADIAKKKASILAEIKIELENLIASDNQLIGIIESQLFGAVTSILAKYDNDVNKETIFEYVLAEKLRNIFLNLNGEEDLEAVSQAVMRLMLAIYALIKGSLEVFIAIITSSDRHNEAVHKLFDQPSSSEPAFLSAARVILKLLKKSFEEYIEAVVKASDSISLISNADKVIIDKLIQKYELDKAINLVKTSLSKVTATRRDIVQDVKQALGDNVILQELKDLLTELYFDLSEIGSKSINTDESLSTLLIEEQLLTDLINMDTFNEFYYTAPVETTHLALEFIGNRDYEKSMVNPDINYDVNNVNNSFVISKIDIDYLDEGISLARTSRLN